MKMVRYKPHHFIDELQKEFFGPWAFDNDKSLVETSDWVPHVDIKEDPDKFIVLADIPGVDPKEIDVSMEGQLLTVRGERKSETKETKENFSRVERSYGSFYRQFTLPETAASDKISAKSKHGVLEITIPKQEKVASRSISIDVEN